MIGGECDWRMYDWRVNAIGGLAGGLCQVHENPSSSSPEHGDARHDLLFSNITDDYHTIPAKSAGIFAYARVIGASRYLPSIRCCPSCLECPVLVLLVCLWATNKLLYPAFQTLNSASIALHTIPLHLCALRFACGLSRLLGRDPCGPGHQTCVVVLALLVHAALSPASAGRPYRGYP
jgi:hypothetical protein